MANYSNYGTISTNGATITLDPQISDTRPKTPGGLIVTATAQVKDGWLGQVLVDKTIVWESRAFASPDSAVDAANRRVVEAVTAWFVDPTPALTVNAECAEE
jgi:hypothetical protein